MNIGMFLEMAAQSDGGRIAITCNGHSLTYRELFQAAQRAAADIKSSGCEYVGLLDVSGMATPIALFAAAYAGVPYVPINYRLTSAEQTALLTRIQPVYLITAAEYCAIYSKNPKISPRETTAFVKKAMGHSQVGSDEIEPQNTTVEPNAIALQIFTSGTTGKPKAAVLRHQHLVSYILASVEFASAPAQELTLVSVPPYHIAGIAVLLSSVYAGRRIQLLPAFDAAAWLRLCQQEAVTNAFIVPTMLKRIIDSMVQQELTGADFPSLRALAYGGGKMPYPVILEALRLFPDVEFTNAYGLTETSSTTTLLGPENHRQAFSSQDPTIRRRLNSVGVPLPGIEISIRDSAGRTLKAGNSGEVYVRGEQVAGEYLEKGSLLNSEGWFPTQDLGYLDDAGYLFLNGRADDIIVRGGENISPGEIEATLLEHPAVEDSAVVAIPSAQWGEAIAAVVVLKPELEVAAEALQALIKAKLRSSRVPEIIQFVDELPYNEMGKLLRREVKARLSSEHKKWLLVVQAELLQLN
ncbi:MAG: acyl--CoA ligase [Gammaproteobacteria bacterium]|nr:acyl--CoA ligase [Gammaproteobacteria bacterium]